MWPTLDRVSSEVQNRAWYRPGNSFDALAYDADRVTGFQLHVFRHASSTFSSRRHFRANSPTQGKATKSLINARIHTFRKYARCHPGTLASSPGRSQTPRLLLWCRNRHETTQIAACMVLSSFVSFKDPRFHRCTRLNAVHNILSPSVTEIPNTKAGQQFIGAPSRSVRPGCRLVRVSRTLHWRGGNRIRSNRD